MNLWSCFLGIWIPSLFIGFCLAASYPNIPTNELLKVFQSTTFDKPRDPISALGIDTRTKMQAFLKTRLSQIGSKNGHEYSEQKYQTPVYADSKTIETINATNYILVVQGSKTGSEDEPLAILANYDTDMNEPNSMDDNGSGVVALVALAEYLSKQVAAGSFKLEKTVIFVGTDTTISKYDYGLPFGGTPGSEQFVKNWLPGFLKGRKFAGAIVLDSIMMFDDRPESQEGRNFSQSFPSASREMSADQFRGNFLALVHRGNQLDSPLAQAFERGWTKSKKEAKEEGNDGGVDPKLITFTITRKTQNSESELHFLQSDQEQFWKQTQTMPALLLTDTRKYRKNECAPSRCNQEAIATSNNMAYLRGNVMAVYSTILELQTDGNYTPDADPVSDDGISTTTIILIVVIAIVVVVLLVAGILYHKNSKKN